MNKHSPCLQGSSGEKSAADEHRKWYDRLLFSLGPSESLVTQFCWTTAWWEGIVEEFFWQRWLWGREMLWWSEHMWGSQLMGCQSAGSRQVRWEHWGTEWGGVMGNLPSIFISTCCDFQNMLNADSPFYFPPVNCAQHARGRGLNLSSYVQNTALSRATFADNETWCGSSLKSQMLTAPKGGQGAQETRSWRSTADSRAVSLGNNPVICSSYNDWKHFEIHFFNFISKTERERERESLSMGSLQTPPPREPELGQRARKLV